MGTKSVFFQFKIVIKKQKLKSKFCSIMCLNQSARISDKINSCKECIQIIFHVWLLFRCKTSKFNVLGNPFSPQRYDRPHYGFRCNIDSKHVTRIFTFNDFVIIDIVGKEVSHYIYKSFLYFRLKMATGIK